MAKVSLILEDLPDKSLRFSMISDPPMIAHHLTDAQSFAVCAHALILQSGANISDLVPVDLLEGYAVPELPKSPRS